MLLVVDFAAVHSAAMVVDSRGKVHFQSDSWGKNILEFAEETALVAAEYEVARAIFEDVPYGITMQFQIKPPLRGQGIVIDQFNIQGILDKLRWLDPSKWQRTFEGVWKGGTKGARAAAEHLGYTPPNMLELRASDIPPLGPEHAKRRNAIRAKLRKAMSDYDDTFLIGEYLRGMTLDEIDAATQPSFPPEE